MKLSQVASLVVIIGLSGCGGVGSVGAGSEDVCLRATQHVADCLGSPAATPPTTCGPQEAAQAEAALQQTCSELSSERSTMGISSFFCKVLSFLCASQAGGGDQDGDGVPDSEDVCPNTPPKASVWLSGQWRGCAGGQKTGATKPAYGDADGDGVVDGQDVCPNTPPNAKVWTEGKWKGCAGGQTTGSGSAANDADGDGVQDAEDQCSNTPYGAKVWTQGEWRGCAAGQYKDKDKNNYHPSSCNVDKDCGWKKVCYWNHTCVGIGTRSAGETCQTASGVHRPDLCKSGLGCSISTSGSACEAPPSWP